MNDQLLKIYFRFRKSNWFWPCLLALAISLYIYVVYYPLFDTVPTMRRYIDHDFVHFSFPQLNFFLKNLNVHSLETIHWNQFASAGSPNLIDSGIYYFPNYLLKPFFKLGGDYISLMTYQLYVLGHYFVAGLGMFFFLKNIVKKSWPAFLGALFFISSSFMLVLVWPGYIMAASWLPWILLTLIKYFDKKRIGWIMLASFISFQQFYICPQFFTYSMILVAGYFLIAQLSLQRVKILFIYYLLTFFYSAIFLVPLYEFSNYSVRLNNINYGFFDTMSTKVTDIWQLLLYVGGQPNISLYLGGVAISLIVIYFSSVRNKLDWAMLGIAVLFFFVSSHSGIFQSIMRFVPGLNAFRWHSRANEIVVFALLLLLVKAIVYYRFNFQRDIKVTGVISSLVLLIQAQFLSPNLEQLYITVFFCFLMALTLIARSKEIINDKTLMIVLCLLIFVDLVRVVNYSQIDQQTNYATTPRGDLAKSEWFFAPANFAEKENSYRISAEGFQRYDYNKFLINQNYAAGSYNPAGGESSPAVLKNYDDYLTAAKSNPGLLKLANINTSLGYLPRAFTQNCFKVEKDDDQLLSKIKDSNFSGEKFIYLSEQPQNMSNDNQNCQSELIPVLSVQNRDEIVFSTINSEQETLLFISDNYYPGWNAFVNGKKTEILRADYTFKAVALPSGANHVTFKYEPQSIRRGVLVTWVSLIGSFFYLLVECFTKRKNVK